MHGFQSYPTDVADINFKRFRFLINEFSEYTEFGYQDHTSGSNNLNFYLPFVSIGLGATYLEKHITFNRNKKGTDYYSSIEPNKFFKFVKSVRNIEKAFILKDYNISNSEKEYIKTIKKVWVAKRNINKNKTISLKNIEIKRVNNPRYNVNLNNILGQKTIKKILKNNQINYSHLKQRILALVIVRSASSRLKNKWKLKINNEPILLHLIKRLSLSKIISNIIVCTTKEKSDDSLSKFLKLKKIKFFRGSTKNVVDRIIKATEKESCNHIVRITGDDILIDPYYLDIAIQHHLEFNADYTDHKKLPPGTETEIFRRDVLKKILTSAVNPNDTEYLTNYIKDYKDQFKVSSAKVFEEDLDHINLTIDYYDDFLAVKSFLKKMAKIDKKYTYTIKDIKDFFRRKRKRKKFVYYPMTDYSWKNLIKYD